MLSGATDIDPRSIFDTAALQGLSAKNGDDISALNEYTYNTVKEFYSTLFQTVVEKMNERNNKRFSAFVGDNATVESRVGTFFPEDVIAEALRELSKTNKNTDACWACLKARHIVELWEDEYVFVVESL